MHKKSLNDWVEYIQTLHVREIDLSLERVRTVYQQLLPEGVSYRVISVAGTNGKGSTCECIASIYRKAGYSVAKYSSPHLVSFTERFNVNGNDVSEKAVLDSFERVEAARSDVRLTFFEFGTLVAIDLFSQSKVDLAVMEVGLGGRLDAVNILSPDVSVITSIAIDHTAWLGDSIDKIAREKFGIARSGQPCVVAMIDSPKVLLDLAKQQSVPVSQLGQDFHATLDAETDIWRYESSKNRYADLPLPLSKASHQLANAAAAVRVTEELQADLPIATADIASGLAAASIMGRCQIWQTEPTIVLDVAHNEASVTALAEFVSKLNVKGRVIALCGMLKDKHIAEALGQIAPIIDEWHIATIAGERGSDAAHVESILKTIAPAVTLQMVHKYAQARDGFLKLKPTLQSDDCLLVFGSFFVTGDIIDQLQKMDCYV